jgi:hypothetical protein
VKEIRKTSLVSPVRTFKLEVLNIGKTEWGKMKIKIKMTNMYMCFDVIYRVMVKHSRLFHLHTFSVSSVV